MPDISMCKDRACPSRDKCYRFKAKPDMLQSYGLFGRPEDADRCGYYWPVESESGIKRLDAAHSGF